MNDQTHSAFPAILEGEIGGSVVQTVNARDLHAALGVSTAFKDWISRRIADYEFIGDRDFCSFLSESSGGRPSKDYALTLDMAKELAMVERNEAGKRVRAYFIECERKLRQAPPTATIDLDDPAFLRGTLLTYTEKVIALQEEVELMRPAVDVVDRLVEAHGSLCITDAAKNLQVSPHVLFRWLRTSGWIYKRTGTNHDVAYQAKLSSGCLVHKVETYERRDGTEGTRTQVRVTPKGLTVLAKAFPPAVSEVVPGRRGVIAGIGALVVAAATALLPAPQAQARALTVYVPPGVPADPMQRAREAWESFAAAMRDATAGSPGWVVQGGERVVTVGYMKACPPWLSASAVDLVPIENTRDGLSDRLRPVAI